jgi:hypothetical protein
MLLIPRAGRVEFDLILFGIAIALFLDVVFAGQR